MIDVSRLEYFVSEIGSEFPAAVTLLSGFDTENSLIQESAAVRQILQCCEKFPAVVTLLGFLMGCPHSHHGLVASCNCVALKILHRYWLL